MGAAWDVFSRSGECVQVSGRMCSVFRPNVFTFAGHVFSSRRRAFASHGPLRRAQGRLFGDAGMTAGAGREAGGERTLACVNSVGPMCPDFGL